MIENWQKVNSANIILEEHVNKEKVEALKKVLRSKEVATRLREKNPNLTDNELVTMRRKVKEYLNSVSNGVVKVGYIQGEEYCRYGAYNPHLNSESKRKQKNEALESANEKKGGFGFQGMNKIFRHTLASDYYVDVDIKNCHPVLVTQWAQMRGLGDKISKLNEYVSNREYVMETYIKEDKESAKVTILRILNGGVYNGDNEWLRSYKSEIDAFHKIVNDIFKDFKPTRGAYSEDGSRFSKFEQMLENIVLYHIYNFFEKRGVGIGALCYDGLLIENKYERDLREGLLEQCQEYVYTQTQYRIDLVIKPMDMGLDLTKALNEPIEELKIEESKSTFDIRDPYYWFDFYNDHHTKIFSTYKEAVESILNNLPRVLVKLEKQNGYIKKLDKDNLFTAHPKLPTRSEFNVRYVENNTTKMLTLQDIYENYGTKMPQYIDITFNPSYEPTPGYLNIWTGLKAQKVDKVDLSKVEPFLQILRLWAGFNFDDEKSAEFDKGYRYLLAWFKNLICNPGKRTQTALVVIGEQGAGKNILVDFIMNMIIGNTHTATVTGISRITQKHNNLIAGKLLICINEMSASGSDSFLQNFDQIKALITDDKITCEPKFKEPYELLNFCAFILLSNHILAMRAEVGDRRYSMHQISDSCKGKTEFWEDIALKFKDPETANHVYTWLTKQNVDDVNLRIPPETELRSEVIQNSKPATILFLEKKVEELFFEQDRPNEIKEYLEQVSDFYLEYIQWSHMEGTDPIPKNKFLALLKTKKKFSFQRVEFTLKTDARPPIFKDKKRPTCIKIEKLN